MWSPKSIWVSGLIIEIITNITNPVEVALGLLPPIFFIIRSRFLRIISSVLSSFPAVEFKTVGVGAAAVVLSVDVPRKKNYIDLICKQTAIAHFTIERMTYCTILPT